MRRFFLYVVLFTSLSLHAQDFKTFFLNKTLRINYIFSGNANEQHIALDELYQEPHWYGNKLLFATTIRGRSFTATPSLPFSKSG